MIEDQSGLKRTRMEDFWVKAADLFISYLEGYIFAINALRYICSLRLMPKNMWIYAITPKNWADYALRNNFYNWSIRHNLNKQWI